MQEERHESRISPVERMRAAWQRYGFTAIAVILHRVLFQWPRLRSSAFSLKVRLLLKSQIGRGVRFGKHVFIAIPGGFLRVGDATTISDRCRLHVSANPRALVSIGKNCYFAPDVHVVAANEITIGDHVQIAEFTSLRDSVHSHADADVLIREQTDVLGKICIGDDVWIGKGSLVLGSLPGTIIGTGAVIGAHTIVKESIPEYAIAVGSPAKIVGYRQHRENKPTASGELADREANN